MAGWTDSAQIAPTVGSALAARYAVVDVKKRRQQLFTINATPTLFVRL